MVRSRHDDSAPDHSAPDHSGGDARVADAQRFVADVEERAVGNGSSGLDRIDGLDRTGTALAVVDSVGRFVDIGLLPGWWTALGPARVAAGLIEALASARLKAALVPLIIRRNGVSPCNPLIKVSNPAVAAEEPAWAGADVLTRARGRLRAAYRLIDDAGPRLGEEPIARVINGPRGLFQLHVRGSHVVGADLVGVIMTTDDTELLVGDARDAIAELGRSRAVITFDYRERLS
jgi:hypothetical protein